MAHAANLSACLGHLPPVEGDGGVGVGGVGVGQPPPQALATVKRTRLRATRKKALDDAMEAEKTQQHCAKQRDACGLDWWARDRRRRAGATGVE